MALPLPPDYRNHTRRHWRRCPFCDRIVYDDQPFEIENCMTWLAGVSSHKIIYKK